MDIKSNQENIFINNQNSTNNYSEKFKLAQALAKSGLIPKELMGENSAYKVFAILVYGEEFGLSPFVALRNIRIIDGNPCMSADLMKSLMFMTKDIEIWEEGFIGKKTSDGRYIINVKDDKGMITLDDDFGYRVYVKRKSIPVEVEATFTIRDARRAKLLAKNNWINYPQDMVRARSISKIAKMAFPEILSKVYTPEELEAGENELKITTPSSINNNIEIKPIALTEEIKVEEIKKEEQTDAIEQDIANEIKEEISDIEEKAEISEKDAVINEINKAKNMLLNKTEPKYIDIPEEIKKLLESKGYDVSKFKFIEGTDEKAVIDALLDIPAYTFYEKNFKEVKSKAMMAKVKEFTKKLINLTITKQEIDVFNKVLIDYIELKGESLYDENN